MSLTITGCSRAKKFLRTLPSAPALALAGGWSPGGSGRMARAPSALHDKVSSYTFHSRLRIVCAGECGSELANASPPA